MSKGIILLLLIFLVFSCNKDEKVQMDIIELKKIYTKKIEMGISKMNILSILNKDSIEYKIFNHNESKNTLIGENITDGDYVLMFIYGESKKSFITTYHSVYIILDSYDNVKMVFFKENYLGP